MSKKVVKILSIDGGGVRGLIPLHIIAAIEEKTGKKSAELFDLIAGNSMGGVQALLLATPDENKKPKYSAEQILEYFREYGPFLFTKNRFHNLLPFLNFFQEKFTTSGVEKLAKKLYGDTTLSEATTEVLIPSLELESNEPFFFKRWQAKKDPRLNFKLSDAAMATTAAPTFLKPYVIDKPLDPDVKHYVFVDGGVFANNPAMCAYVEAKTIFPDADEFLVVSLGIGNVTAKILLETAKGWGISQWLIPIIYLFRNSMSDIVDHQLNTLLKAESDQLNHYFRFQMRLLEQEAPLDDSRPIPLHVMNLLAANFAKDSAEQIDEVCALLTK